MSDFTFSKPNTLGMAQGALKRGDRQEARRLAQTALREQPNDEESWLLLAALSNPRASLIYLQRALQLNPTSQRARQGLHWAIQRMRNEPPSHTQPRRLHLAPRRLVNAPIASDALVAQRPILAPWIFIMLLLALAISAWISIPQFPTLIGASRGLAFAGFGLIKETRTPTFTPTSTSTFTPTATNTPTPTATTTSTSTPTLTASPTETATPQPTKKPKKKKNPAGKYNYPGRPGGVDANERWIDIDLSQQAAYAYEGDTLVNSFTVSTGTWLHPTVQGTFKIYVKYRYADMSGPGYYLANVPYVMYFYKDYGLHGTYWHNNFGTPMSHGCVNFRTTDAGWIYDFSRIGTVVNVHP
jgi:lipoprotein-anchoring transpeptidase ErfK/SrfK